MIVTEQNYRNFNVGAKAENLFFLRESGVNVPPFFCFFGEDIPEAAEYAECFFEGGEKVALRSSASAEDGTRTSFAGQFCTCLHLDPEDISRVARQVCAVPAGQGFREYCRVNGIDTGGIRVCVIAQKMIEPELSGSPPSLRHKISLILSACSSSFKSISRESSGESPLCSAVRDGQIYILQARPVTTLGPADRAVILDNSNIVESYPGIARRRRPSGIRSP